MNNKTPFHLYGSESFSGPEDKRSNIITKDVTFDLISEEVPKDLGALYQEPCMKTHYV